MSAVAVSAATVTPSVAVAAATRLPPPLPPTLRCITVQARTISIEWTSNFNPASDSTEETSIKLLDSDTMLHIQYQLSKSEENSGVYQVVYEGGARTFNISSLIPLTKYTFKLRVKWDDDPEDNWSKSSTQIEVKTTGISIIFRVANVSLN